MDPNNITCVQKVRIFFYFFELREWPPGEKSPYESIVKDKNITSQEVRRLKDFLTTRLERIAAMMDILWDIHDDWALRSKKEYILMETKNLDFNVLLNALKEKGFSDDEFILKVEYDRKWGVL